MSKVIVRLNDQSLAMDVVSQLEKKLNKNNSNITVIPWEELEAISFGELSEIENQLILSIILMFAAIAIINTVILSALERMKEIEMMKALGLQTREVVSWNQLK
ncbi:MAG: FtsX-like permease family protein [Firmicutes bacterium]|nr:FtsX-like permease family protein [Bacillota bacterium]